MQTGIKRADDEMAVVICERHPMARWGCVKNNEAAIARSESVPHGHVDLASANGVVRHSSGVSVESRAPYVCDCVQLGGLCETDEIAWGGWW